MKSKNVFFICAGFFVAVAAWAADPKRVADADYDWVDVSKLGIGGRGYVSSEEPFVRFPKKQREMAPEKIRRMSRESTGLNFKFRTTSKKLVFRYTVEKRSWTDPLIPPSGLQSVSVWERRKGEKDWEFVRKNHPKQDGDNEYVLAWTPDSTGWLYLPMRGVVRKFSIGIERGKKFETVPYENPGKVVIYGTSIVHGGCVSSAGMMFTSFMGRRLDRDVVAFGFSGGGRMEIVMADLLSEVEATVYILDCDWNMSEDMMKERYEPFIRRLRKLRPSTPILLCGGCTEKKTPLRQEVFGRSVYDRLKAEDPELWEKLYFLSGVDALPKCSWATHDHCHPNDFGAPFMGEVYARRVAGIIASGARGSTK